jgi:penicillin-binding protein 2B
MRPFVMKEIVNPKTKEVLETTLPKAVRQVVSKQTAKQLSQYLEEVVSDPLGTGRRAAIEGYQVAGKTGTAQKVIDGIYSIEKYIVSFIGYAPVEDPKIIIYVVADEPELQGDYRNGGLVTFPVFRDVMAKSLRYLNIPTIDHTPIETGIAISNVEEEVLLTPLFTDLNIQQAKQQLRISGLNGEFYGRGQHILAQFPPVGSEISDSQRIYMATSDLDTVDLPDLTGKSLREALEICSFIKVVCRPYGEGYVTNQAASEAEREYVLEFLSSTTETI